MSFSRKFYTTGNQTSQILLKISAVDRRGKVLLMIANSTPAYQMPGVRNLSWSVSQTIFCHELFTHTGLVFFKTQCQSGPERKVFIHGRPKKDRRKLPRKNPVFVIVWHQRTKHYRLISFWGRRSMILPLSQLLWYGKASGERSISFYSTNAIDTMVGQESSLKYCSRLQFGIQTI